jgi:hypothetical protein
MNENVSTMVKKKVIGEPWFPGLTLKKVLNWDFY